jgi:hypothetical protein
MVFMMKRGKSYRTDEILKGICGCLENDSPKTPSSVARCLDIHPKTAERYINTGKELGILQCNEITMGKNRVTLCKINPDYQEVWKKLKKK